ncbi:NADPH-dependent 2,4-dienoyl-CoA reductase/sulfur reductase-like enzyme [Catenulispora sp. EB89]|uniref:FAD-dependent oxidoreductase n=1 Tax=Catenulispora sp. EB89 TaxID=3156257 RepID=UPI0035112D8A
MSAKHVVAIGGSDAGISAALRARELDPSSDVTVLLADGYPNFSICGIPYFLSGEVADWGDLAHRTMADLEASGMHVVPWSTAVSIDAEQRRVGVCGRDGRLSEVAYDELIVATGADSVRPPIAGLRELGPDRGVFLLRSIGDARALMDDLSARQPGSAVIVGGGYTGLEMAEALMTRGVQVTQIEALPQVLPTVDADLGALIRAELALHGVEVLTGTTVAEVTTDAAGLTVRAKGPDGQNLVRTADVVLVVAGVRPNTALAEGAGVRLGARGAIAVDRQMRTSIPHMFAAGDCATTHHRLLGETWLPLGTTAHKQGRIAGENALGGSRKFAGSLGTQVVKVFDLVAARTGLHTAGAAAAGRGWSPVDSLSVQDDHRRYYPGVSPITIKVTGDRDTGLLLGAQLVGHVGAEIAKRVDIYATALFHGMRIEEISDLDLSYAPPLASTWDAVQAAAQVWDREHQRLA